MDFLAEFHIPQVHDAGGIAPGQSLAIGTVGQGLNAPNVGRKECFASREVADRELGIRRVSDDFPVRAPADDIDPEYGSLLRSAKEAGVLITVALIGLSPSEIRFTGETLKAKL